MLGHLPVRGSAWGRALVVAAFLLGLAGCSGDEPTDHSGHTPSADSSRATQ